MGSKVLEVISASPELRAYAHCSKTGASQNQRGAVTLLLINLSNTTTAEIDSVFLKTVGQNVLSYGYRQEYIISSAVSSDVEEDILQSKNVMLNGKLLSVTDYKVPELYPVVIDQEAKKSQHSTAVVMAPLTYGFIVFPVAEASVC